MAKTKNQLKDLKTFTFEDREGNQRDLAGFFEKDDFYEKTKGKAKTVIGIFVKHSAIQRLAAEAGVEMLDVQMLVQPNGSNEQQHLFTAVFRHGKDSIMEVGEASTRNTSPGISRNYMGTMGFKRLFDRGVLNVLGFYELYSQEEADDLNEGFITNSKISSKELEAIGSYLNAIVNAPTVAALDAAMSQAIADRKAGKVTFTDAQRNYLRTIYQTNRFNLELTAEEKALEGKEPAVPTTPVTTEAPTPIAARVAEANALLERKAQDAEAKVASGQGEKFYGPDGQEVPFE